MEYSTQIIGAFLIILLGLISSRIIYNITKKAIIEFELKYLFKKVGLERVERQIPVIIRFLIIILSIIFALLQLGISFTAIKILLIIMAIITIIFILLSFKDILPNLISGILIKRSKKLRIGETIKIKNIKGKVLRISLLETEIKTKNNETVHIPNSLLR